MKAEKDSVPYTVWQKQMRAEREARLREVDAAAVAALRKWAARGSRKALNVLKRFGLSATEGGGSPSTPVAAPDPALRDGEAGGDGHGHGRHGG